MKRQRQDFRIGDEVRVFDNGNLSAYEKTIVGDIGFVRYKDEYVSEVHFYFDDTRLILSNEKITLLESLSIIKVCVNLFTLFYSQTKLFLVKNRPIKQLNFQKHL